MVKNCIQLEVTGNHFLHPCEFVDGLLTVIKMSAVILANMGFHLLLSQGLSLIQTFTEPLHT
jgi:hypothetical protein